jgi:four helix bundle protein
VAAERTEIRDFTDLRAWQAARALVKDVYRMTEGFPNMETFALAHQLRRAAVSVPSNIAEGYGRGSLRDYLRFLQNARGSLYEVHTQLLLAEDLGYLDSNGVALMSVKVKECTKLLQALIASLSRLKEGAR